MTRLAWIAVVLAACDGGSGGDDGDDGPDRVDEFIGRWLYPVAITMTFDCDDDRLDMTEDEGGVSFAAGTSSDLVTLRDPDHPCPPLRLDVDGSTAKAQPGQTCSDTFGTPPDVITFTTSFDEYTATLDAAGTAITLQGDLAAMFTGTVTTKCVVSVSGSGVKSSARVTGEPRRTWTDALARRLR